MTILITGDADFVGGGSIIEGSISQTTIDDSLA